MTDPQANRRAFLTGQALQQQLAQAGDAVADALLDAEAFDCGPTVRLGQRSMACDFEVILNPGPVSRLSAASAGLELVDRLEQQLSVYRADSELCDINRRACGQPVEVEPRLFELLQLCQELSAGTDGAFDPTAGPLIRVWHQAKAEHRLPTDEELTAARDCVGMSRVELDPQHRTVHFPVPGMSLNLGSIGKGYALDRAAEVIAQQEVESFLLQGGQSSLLARGGSENLAGWPVGIAHPLFPERQLATLLLQNAGLSTSGSNIQFFRLAGKRYGHLLDPRTGWPAEGLSSVTVIAPTAAWAEALSTAFFVLGVEKALDYCHNHPLISAVFVPTPTPGQSAQLISWGVPDNCLRRHSD